MLLLSTNRYFENNVNKKKEVDQLNDSYAYRCFQINFCSLITVVDFNKTIQRKIQQKYYQLFTCMCVGGRAQTQIKDGKAHALSIQCGMMMCALEIQISIHEVIQ